MDMKETIIANSDQLNADDLIGGPEIRVIKNVARNVDGDPKQKVNVFFEGYEKPWRPNKTMCRILVNVWGDDPKAYIGRRVELYRNPDVIWAGMKVGGIQISRMSHMENNEVGIMLTTTRGRKGMFTIKKLPDNEKATEPKAETNKEPDQPAWILKDGIVTLREGVTPNNEQKRELFKMAREQVSNNSEFLDANMDFLSEHLPDSGIDKLKEQAAEEVGL